MGGKRLVERRKHMRFKVRDGAFAVLRAHARKPRQIVDISKGGLAFRYIAYGERSNGSAELDILSHDNRFCLEKLPVNTISDFEISDKAPLSYTTVRRCGVHFRDLTESQISGLDYFIQNYTVGEA